MWNIKELSLPIAFGAALIALLMMLGGNASAADCVGYIGPGGACSTEPGGGLTTAPGDERSTAPRENPAP